MNETWWDDDPHAVFQGEPLAASCTSFGGFWNLWNVPHHLPWWNVLLMTFKRRKRRSSSDVEKWNKSREDEARRFTWSYQLNLFFFVIINLRTASASHCTAAHFLVQINCTKEDFQRTWNRLEVVFVLLAVQIIRLSWKINSVTYIDRASESGTKSDEWKLAASARSNQRLQLASHFAMIIEQRKQSIWNCSPKQAKLLLISLKVSS